MIEQLESRLLFSFHNELVTKAHHYLTSRQQQQINIDLNIAQSITPQVPTNVSVVINYGAIVFSPFDTVSNNSQPDLSATVSWDYTNSDSFNIYRSTTDKNPSSFVQIGTVSGTNTFVDNDISEHTNYFYYYEVTAVNNGVESAPSTTIILGLLNVSQTVTNQTVKLIWSSSSSAIYYVYRSDNDGPYQWLANTYNSTYTDTITDNQFHIYKVFGANEYVGYSLPVYANIGGPIIGS